VDARHQAVPDAHRLMQHLRHRREAVCRAGSVGDDPVPLGVVGLVEVHAERHCDVGLFRGSRDDHALSAGLEVLAGCVSVAEAPARLDHDVDRELSPRQVGGIGFGEDGDLGAVDGQHRVAGRGDLGREAAEHGIATQQMRQRAGVHNIVDRHHLDVSATQVGGPEHASADPAETADRHSDSHQCLLARLATVLGGGGVDRHRSPRPASRQWVRIPIWPPSRHHDSRCRNRRSQMEAAPRCGPSARGNSTQDPFPAMRAHGGCVARC
jgi:hypothetical protein